MYELYLCHHGIKGQKWGIRRFQYENGDLTPAGEKRYGIGLKSKANVSNIKGDKKIQNASGKGDKIIQNTSGKDKPLTDKEIGFMQRSLKTYFIEKQGFSPEEAEVSAARTAKATKIAMAVAAGALIAGTVYCVYKSKRSPFNDFTIEAGTKIQRITPFSDSNVRDQFYGAIGKKDQAQYKWQLANIRKSQGAKDIFAQEMAPKSSIKVAGIKKSERLFSDLMKNDPEFRKSVDSTGIKTYAEFNRYMIGRDEIKMGPGVKNPFVLYQKRLKDLGYGALIDHNDAVGLGLKSDRPIIFFGQTSNISVNAVKRVLDSDVSEAKVTYNKKKMIDSYIAAGGLAAGGIGATSTIASADFGFSALYGHTANKKAVKRYKEEHPNTNLSDIEIMEMYQTGRFKK